MTKRTVVFLGLDIESTSSASPPDAQLIQVGAKVEGHSALFTMDVGHDQFTFTEEARKANGFTDERVRAAMRPPFVDASFEAWLKEQGVGSDCGTRGVAVGWNVGGFDIPFVRYYLPQSFKRLSYQTVDLNTLCFSIAKVRGIPFHTIKTQAKEYSDTTQAGFTTHRHDAGYDAAAALYEWEFLLDLIRLNGWKAE